MVYEHEWSIRFGEVDQAGIIYYPNLFDAVHHGVEELLETVGFPFYDLVLDEGVGMPIVHAEADYFNPIRYGDTVQMEITPTLTESSVTFTGEGFIGDEHVFSVVEKHATIDMDTFESIPVPDELRSALSEDTASQ